MRYLIHYSDGGAGMRHRDEPPWPGDEVTDGGASYKVMRVDQPPNDTGFGHAWVERDVSERETSGREPPGLG